MLGPIVGGLQSAFSENWTEETGEVIVGPKFFPPLQPAGHVQTHLAYYFDHGSVSSVDLLYRVAFASARRELWIQNPYLAPDNDVLELLRDAADRGVDVRLMLPGFSDFWAPVSAGRSHYDELLAAGVRIYEWREALMHAKTAVIDSHWSSVGSTNLDWRSFTHNYEADLIVEDAGFAREMEKRFQLDIQAATPIDSATWRDRGLASRVKEWVARQWQYLL